MWGSRLAAVLVMGAIWALPSAASAAVEHVNDGGFEGASCDATQCTDSVWTQTTTGAFANSSGPICRAGTGSGNTACNGQGSAAFSGSTWARLGAGYKGAAIDGGVISSVEQAVPIPTAPATLSFRLRIIDVPGPTGAFKVEVAGTQVFGVTDTTGGFASYAPVSIDVSSLAGTTPLIHFEGFSGQVPIGALDSFDVDDISLTTVSPVDSRCATLRAKLKKAKSKKKRRKIRKRIRALGC